MKKYKFFGLISVLSLLFTMACTDDFKKEGPIGKILKNDCIKRTLGPNMAGLDIEFVYAMAIPPDKGKLQKAWVEASIAGDSETYLEHRSFYTDGSGADVGVEVGSPCVNSGNKTEVAITADTCAAALRYFYRIPESAKGKEVSFTFSVTASNGETVSYKMGPYKISKMDMVRNLNVSTDDKCYISIADMAVYDAESAAANAAKIDLVYMYRSISGITFGHAYASPAANAEYRPDVSIPSGANNNTFIRKVYGLRDRHLANLQYGIYVDDIDLETIKLSDMPNYALNVLNEAGMWVETQDGKYRAYIYINSINAAGTAVLSMKRLTVK